MRRSEGKLTGIGEMSIFYQYWQPESAPSAVMLLVHGAGEHSSRYQHVAEKIVARGYAVAALDLPNHGKSDGHYGHVDRFDDFLQTLEIYHRQVKADFSGIPQILLGHSMGGLISTLFLLQHQKDFLGCVLSGPAIKSDIEPGWLQMMLIKGLSALAPKTGVLQLDPAGVSREQAEVDKYVSDPLVNHGKMTARKVAEMFIAMGTIQQNADKIVLPMLLLHGEADSMASAEGSRFLYQQLGSADKTLTIYPGLYHEIFNEPEWEHVLGEAIDWCDARLEAQT